jgi:hypothetical protein
MRGVVLALAIAGLAITINAQIGRHFGTTTLASATFGRRGVERLLEVIADANDTRTRLVGRPRTAHLWRAFLTWER